MTRNLKNALGLIFTLSLLLGLSLGQIHRQHLKIKQLERKASKRSIVKFYPNYFHQSSSFPRINIDFKQLEEQLERTEVKIERLNLLRRDLNRSNRELQKLRRFNCYSKIRFE